MIHLHSGYERIVEKEAGTFKYFLKIVPTEYVNLSGDPRPLTVSCDIQPRLSFFSACHGAYVYSLS